MDLGDISKLMGDGCHAKIPDLDWASIDIEDKDNIPVPMNVRIIPQLVESWSYTGKDRAASIIPNQSSTAVKDKKINSEDVKGVVDTAKKEMMSGLVGKDLASKLASAYPASLIRAAKPELQKLAEEQGLLGKVYIDLTPFDSCKEAARVLGNNKIRLAKYVVGEPKRHKCSSHDQGICRELNKKVIASMDYSDAVLSEYSDHLKVAGILDKSASLESKEQLRDALLYSNEKTAAKSDKKKDGLPKRTFEEVRDEFKSALSKKASATEVQEDLDRFSEVRPILAFIQNEMLKGHMGGSLKSAIQAKYSGDVIQRFAGEIKKIASLQGLLGNVYVDVSLYRDSEEAIGAIKSASTSPTYIVQTVKSSEFDNFAEKVAKATGCQILPRNGKIDTKIASSYIDDLQFSDRLSSDKANALRDVLSGSDNVLGILREAFIATQDHAPAKRQGGVKGYYRQDTGSKYASRDGIKEAAYKAVVAGIALDKLESKLSTVIPTAEAAGMVRDVLASVEEVDANVLSNCTTERYHFSSTAKLKKASKCSSCILRNCDVCMSQSIRFASKEDDKSDMLVIDPNTKKVTLADNPDVVRNNLDLEKDMEDSRWGSGSNIMLDTISKESSADIDNSFNNEGLDSGLSDL
jgi:O-acetyl-ADP-ribose deacetylase (regulator of RNase III)